MGGLGFFKFFPATILGKHVRHTQLGPYKGHHHLRGAEHGTVLSVGSYSVGAYDAVQGDIEGD